MTMGIEEQDASARSGALVREVYFPTFIYYKDLVDSQALNGEIKPHIYAWRDADQAGIVRSNVEKAGAWHSQVDMHQRQEYGPLGQRIVATVQEIFGDLGYDPGCEPSLDNMWANVSPKFGYNRHHVHPKALWSGVYYVQAPPRGRSHLLLRSTPPGPAAVTTLRPEQAAWRGRLDGGLLSAHRGSHDPVSRLAHA